MYVFNMPKEISGGVYANNLMVWHTSHEFTLDFYVFEPSQTRDDGETIVPCRGVARIKIAPSLIFDVTRVLAENQDRYEKRYGPIPKIEVKEPPPTPPPTPPPMG